MSRRTLKPEERLIWHKVTRSVKPLEAERAEPAKTQAAEPEAGRSTVKTGSGRPPPSSGTSVSKRQTKPPPADRSAERRLRRGRITIDARIDLHGMTQDHARRALGHFLHGARARGQRLVLVITGKGKAGARSRDPYEPESGILKRRLPDWLAEPELRHLVSGYARAHQRHGGEGAFYVTIRNPGVRE